MGLYKNEAVAKTSPFVTEPLKTLADVEKLTFDFAGLGQKSAPAQRTRENAAGRI